MLATVACGAVVGIDGTLVAVETDVANGLPHFTVVGLGDTAIQESKDRVRAAIRNAGYKFPSARVTVNLAPADVRKAGPGFDLAIAVGLLAASEQLAQTELARFLFLAEVSLDGSLRPVRGVLPVALAAKAAGLGMVLARENVREATLVEGLQVWGFGELGEIVDFLTMPNGFAPSLARSLDGPALCNLPDFAEIKGQGLARRALEICAGGHHNGVFVGPPGSGKSMLARRLPSILPDLSRDEALEITRIYSVAGLLQRDTSMLSERPFRAPHHSISVAGLVGGSAIPKPGEVSLAHTGALFLDELAEFSRGTLEMLRQPLEDRQVVISRARATATFPADFLLLGAMNPCPCGYDGDRAQICKCPTGRIVKYWSRLSGPLMDRIDMQVDVPRLTPEEILSRPSGESSASVRSRVMAARERQIHRSRHQGGPSSNARMAPADMRKHVALDAASNQLMRSAIRVMAMSARSCDRILKVARTIADLEGRDRVKIEHLQEAIQFRQRATMTAGVLDSALEPGA